MNTTAIQLFTVQSLYNELINRGLQDIGNLKSCLLLKFSSKGSKGSGGISLWHDTYKSQHQDILRYKNRQFGYLQQVIYHSNKPSPKYPDPNDHVLAIVATKIEYLPHLNHPDPRFRLNYRLDKDRNPRIIFEFGAGRPDTAPRMVFRGTDRSGNNTQLTIDSNEMKCVCLCSLEIWTNTLVQYRKNSRYKIIVGIIARDYFKTHSSQFPNFFGVNSYDQRLSCIFGTFYDPGCCEHWEVDETPIGTVSIDVMKNENQGIFGIDPFREGCEANNLTMLEEIKDLLLEKKQVILYGPPGTSKTFMALCLAKKLCDNDPRRFFFVQFHPNYGYEDFVEGLTTEVIGGTVHYKVEKKVFREACDKAEALLKASDKKNVVLIIDEINRGDLPRIFGELIFGLEYRGVPIRTLYMKEKLRIPENLLIIGTMNSVDRSIALVDFALRRRFHFYECMPSVEVLETWLDEKAKENALHVDKKDVLKLFREINDKIKELLTLERLSRHYQIGHAFFFVKDVRELKINWENMIVPLLEEYFNHSREAFEEFEKIYDEIIAKKYLGK